MSFFPACIFRCHVHVWLLQKSKAGIVSHRTGIIDSCEFPSEDWKSNPGPLRKQQAS